MSTEPARRDEPGGRSREWLQPFDRLHEEMDRLFGEYSHALPFARARTGGDGVMAAHLDVSESDSAVEVTLDVPGMAEKDIDIHLTDKMLFIQGKREHTEEEKRKNFYRVERSFGSFQRRIPLPCEIEHDGVTASLAKGVLSITLPKSKRAQAQDRRIEISSDS